MVEVKQLMIDNYTNKDISEDEYRSWVDWVLDYNHNNPKEPICYEVRWKDKEYSVKLLNLSVDKEGKE